jgi:phage gpG-like protein
MNNGDVVKTVEEKVKAVLKNMPKLVGNEVVNFSKDNFRRQGFLGDTFEAWPKRKAGSKFGKTQRNNGRAILVDSGRLRRGTRVISADWNEVVIGNDVPYAKAHNEGLRIGLIQNVRAHRRKRTANNVRGIIGAGKMNKKGTAQKVKIGKTASGITFVKAHKRRINQRIPKRQFLGSSPYLTRNIQRLIASEIQKAIS